MERADRRRSSRTMFAPLLSSLAAQCNLGCGGQGVATASPDGGVQVDGMSALGPDAAHVPSDAGSDASDSAPSVGAATDGSDAATERGDLAVDGGDTDEAAPLDGSALRDVADGGDVASGNDAGFSLDGGGASAGCLVQTIEQVAGGPHCPVLAAGVPSTVDRVTIWIEGSGASPAQSVFLVPNTPVIAGGHTYVYRGDALFGDGVTGTVSGTLIGSVDIQIDGIAAQAHFEMAGCTGAFGADAGSPASLVAIVGRRRVGCSTCSPATVARTYAVAQAIDAGLAYDFTSTAAPSGCGFGIDLTEFELR